MKHLQPMKHLQHLQLLTDLPKAFDYFPQGLIIAKLNPKAARGAIRTPYDFSQNVFPEKGQSPVFFVAFNVIISFHKF